MIRIKAERVMKGLTQEQFAKEMKVTTYTAQKWEYGQTNIPCSVICRLADFFGMIPLSTAHPYSPINNVPILDWLLAVESAHRLLPDV